MKLQKLCEDPPGPKQNVPDQREKETQVFGEEGKEGGNAGTVLTHCQRKLKKEGGVITKVILRLLDSFIFPFMLFEESLVLPVMF